MPSVGDIKAGRAYVEVGANLDPLLKEMGRAANAIQQWGRQLATIGTAMTGFSAAGLAPAVFGLKQLASAGSELATGSIITGVPAEALSALGYAAQQVRVPMEALENAFARMSRNISGMTLESGAMKTAFAALKLSFSDLSGLSQEARFELIADRLASIRDPAIRAGAALTIFGRGAQDVIPLLALGSSGMKSFEDAARSLHIPLTNLQADLGLQLNQAMTTLWDVVVRLSQAVAIQLAPTVIAGAAAAAQFAGRTIELVEAHKQLIVGIANALVSVGAVGGGLLVAAGAAYTFGLMLTGAKTIGVIFTGAMSALKFGFDALSFIIAAATGGLAAFSDEEEQATVAGLALEGLKKGWAGVIAGIAAGALAVGGIYEVMKKLESSTASAADKMQAFVDAAKKAMAAATGLGGDLGGPAGPSEKDQKKARQEQLELYRQANEAQKQIDQAGYQAQIDYLRDQGKNADAEKAEAALERDQKIAQINADGEAVRAALTAANAPSADIYRSIVSQNVAAGRVMADYDQKIQNLQAKANAASMEFWDNIKKRVFELKNRFSDFLQENARRALDHEKEMRDKSSREGVGSFGLGSAALAREVFGSGANVGDRLVQNTGRAAILLETIAQSVGLGIALI